MDATVGSELQSNNESNASQDSNGDALLYRAISSGSWREEPVFAFYLKEKDKDNGLSVLTRLDCFEGFCMIPNVNTCYGELFLDKVGVLSISGLSLEMDNAFPGHALIKGLPYRGDSDEAAMQAERMATLLSKAVINKRVIKKFIRKPQAC